MGSYSRQSPPSGNSSGFILPPMGAHSPPESVPLTPQNNALLASTQIYAKGFQGKNLKASRNTHLAYTAKKPGVMTPPQPLSDLKATPA